MHNGNGGKGCVRTCLESVYREPGERIRSTCPDVQHPETMRVGAAVGIARCFAGEQRAESSATLQSLPTSEAPLPMRHHSIASCHSGDL